MILSIEGYIARFNDCPEYLRRLSKPKSTFAYADVKNAKTLPQLAVGMLKWSDTDADRWAGPFEGNFAFFCITDYNDLYPEIRSVAEIDESEITHHKYSSWSWPYGFAERYLGKKIAEQCSLTNKDLDILLATGNEKAINYYNKEVQKSSNNLHFSKETPTKEFPIKFYLCGNDDSSWTKYFAYPEDALEYLEQLEQNPTFAMIEKDFVFTN